MAPGLDYFCPLTKRAGSIERERSSDMQDDKAEWQPGWIMSLAIWNLESLFNE